MDSENNFFASDIEWYTVNASHQRTEAACVNVQCAIVSLQRDLDGLRELIMCDRQDRLQQALLTAQLQEQLQAQNLHLQQVADAQKTATNWICPVCNETYQSMRKYYTHTCHTPTHTNPHTHHSILICCNILAGSYKAHIKKLVYPTAENPHCCLKETVKRHVNLVSRSKGETFPVKSKAFAKDLWEHVQQFTSSDDSSGT